MSAEVISNPIYCEIDALSNLGAQRSGGMAKGHRIAPVELYDAARKSLHFVGLPGLIDNRRFWPRYGSLGCAGQSGRHAALCSARRFDRRGEGIQQQRPVHSAMAGEIEIAQPISIREAGLDEYWLQSQITDNMAPVRTVSRHAKPECVRSERTQLSELHDGCRVSAILAD